MAVLTQPYRDGTHSLTHRHSLRVSEQLPGLARLQQRNKHATLLQGARSGTSVLCERDAQPVDAVGGHHRAHRVDAAAGRARREANCEVRGRQPGQQTSPDTPFAIDEDGSGMLHAWAAASMASRKGGAAAAAAVGGPSSCCPPLHARAALCFSGDLGPWGGGVLAGWVRIGNFATCSLLCRSNPCSASARRLCACKCTVVIGKRPRASGAARAAFSVHGSPPGSLVPISACPGAPGAAYTPGNPAPRPPVALSRVVPARRLAPARRPPARMRGSWARCWGCSSGRHP